MKLSKSGSLMGILGVLLGVGGTLAAQRLLPKPRVDLLMDRGTSAPNADSAVDDFLNDDFFDRSRDPFEAMRRMQKRMLKDFAGPNTGGGLFGSWHRPGFGSTDSGELKRREDSNFVYYDIDAKDLDKDKLKVKVENGQITISGRVERKADPNAGGAYFSSSFHRSFPAPPNVDADRVRIEQSKDVLTLAFPKIGSDA